MRFKRLSYQILLVFVLVIVVCLGVSGWFVIQLGEDIVTRKSSEGDQNFAGRIAQEIEAEMASVKPTLMLLAETPGLRLMEATEVKVEIDRVQRGLPEITSIYVADMEGEQIYRTGTEELENVSSIWSFQVAKGGDKLFSDIYLKPATSEPMQTITLPIMDSGKVVGVLSADVSFRRIMLSFMGIDVGENGNVVVVADNGRVVAHTRIEQVPELDLSRLPVVEAALAGEEGTMKGYTDELGREVLGSYVPIKELGWGVLIQRPVADVYAEVRQLRTTIMWVMIAAILLVVPAGWLMSRQIAKPIGQLASASERVAQGDLSTPVDVKSSNEIGVLANSFNQMIVSLKSSRDELEQRAEELRTARDQLEIRVAERTADLAVAMEKAQEADRLKSVFLATMSHELRTPLNSIIGFTGIMRQGLAGELNEEQEKQLDMVYGSAKHLLALISDILDISKIEAGEIELAPSEFDVSALIQEVVKTLAPMAETKGLEMIVSISPPVGEMYSDRRRVEQILLNLVNNAIKFTEQGEVRTEAQIVDEHLQVSVQDTGIGIKEEDMGKLFQPFRQIDDSRARRYEGTGLGLNVCKRLVDLLGGQIWAESEYGVGSKFAFTLPLRSEQQEP